MDTTDETNSNKDKKLNDNFYYVHSCSLPHRIQIKIGDLEGLRKKKNFRALYDDPGLKFTGPYQDGYSDLFVKCEVYDKGVPLTLAVTTKYKPFSTRYNWNEWVTLPIQYNDLSRTALLALTIYDCGGPNKLVPIGGTTISLFSKHGLFRRGIVDLCVWPDVEADGNFPSKTPGKDKSGSEKVHRLTKLKKRYEAGYINEVPWLDKLTFRDVETISENGKRTSNRMYLMVEFPTVHVDGVQHQVVYFEQDSDEVYQFKPQADLVTCPDCEISKENLVEDKYHKMARSQRSGQSDKDAKPTAAIRNRLQRIVAYPSITPLSSEEQDLVWKFRFFLSSDKKALTKFLKCVNWGQHGEVKQALKMLEIWAPMDVEDALELLGPNFTHPEVRLYALSRLKEAPDEDLVLYLLQLVQALKYENFEKIKEGVKRISERGIVPQDDGSPPDTTKHVEGRPEPQDLASFLIYRACRNTCLANYFSWYVECEFEDFEIKLKAEVKEMYMLVLRTFFECLSNGSQEMTELRKALADQRMFIEKLIKLIETAGAGKDRPGKESAIRECLKNPDMVKYNFLNFDEPVVLPLDPNYKIKGIIPEKTAIFISHVMPIKFHFRTTDDEEYIAIFKKGDDLRQDQLVLQMITLINKLLLKENLDLKLTPYKVLPTHSRAGFVQYVNAQPITKIIQNEGSILNYLKRLHPQESMPLGVKPEIIDNYVRSCAGYCIITFLFSVGDRHMDNILITTDGKIFHIDFSYILGRDPKPLTPVMNLTREMVEAMGGANSIYFQEFRNHCYTSYIHLRDHGNLILNLFSLMVDSNITDIALEPDKAVRKIDLKLMRGKTEEEIMITLQEHLNESMNALFPVIIEQVHRFAQMLRK